MIVLDTSALAKLLIEENESAHIRSDLFLRDRRGTECAISTIAITELRRLAIRMNVAPKHLEPVVGPFTVLRLTEGILQLAGRLPTRQLGTLDALHIATALVAEAHTLMTFDERQGQAARAERLTVVHPGR